MSIYCVPYVSDTVMSTLHKYLTKSSKLCYAQTHTHTEKEREREENGSTKLGTCPRSHSHIGGKWQIQNLNQIHMNLKTLKLVWLKIHGHKSERNSVCTFKILADRQDFSISNLVSALSGSHMSPRISLWSTAFVCMLQLTSCSHSIFDPRFESPHLFKPSMANIKRLASVCAISRRSLVPT